MHIAKAEFYIQTSSFRERRKEITVGLYAFGVVWALVLAPIIMTVFIDTFAGSFVPLIMVGLPGFMRSGILFLWIFLMLLPMSFALKEIKIGQWEIMLSHGVSTKNILFGTFMGKIPSYALIVLYFAPLFLTPFAYVYRVSIVGQALMYVALFAIATGTLYLGDLLTIAIQAKLGESPRGNDIANALTWILAIVLVIPMYVVMFYASTLTQVLGMNIFLVFPFTWGADVITWVALLFNGIGLTPQDFAIFQTTLQLDLLTVATLLGSFFAGTVIIGVISADRFFSFEAGARTEKIVTVGEENLLVRAIHKIAPGAYGVRVITALKDFSRKAQNLSGLTYAVIVAIILPFLMVTAYDFAMEEVGQSFLFTFMGIMLASMSGITFGGIGFLDSRDQLWIIQSTPHGVTKYIKARITQGLLIGIPLVILTGIISAVVLNLTIPSTVQLMVQNYVFVAAAVLIGVGVTAGNPDYEDTKSSNFRANTMSISMSISMAGMFSVMGCVFGSILDIPIAIMILESPFLMGVVPCVVLMMVAIPMFLAGVNKLAHTEE